MKKQLLLFVFILLSMMANATVTIKHNGVYYKLIGYGNKQKYAKVTRMPDDGYTGSVVISSTVTFENVTYNVTSIESYAFQGCHITSVTIPNSVTSIEYMAFSGCTGLTSVTIDGVESIGDRAFYSCTGLTSITIPNSVTDIGNQAFRDCHRLTSVTIGNGVESIGDLAFDNCRSLTSVTIGNSVTSIGSRAFYDCRSLTSVTIGNSVTSILQETFYNCHSLTSITIGNSVESIGLSAFYSCYGLTDLYCYAEKVPTVSSSFSGIPVSIATLHVPAASIDAYKAADQWKEFGTIVALTPEETGVKPITATEKPSDRKFMENGRLIIQKNGQRYNVAGQMVKEK